MIKVFELGSREYIALQFAASAMTFMSTECEYRVEDTYFDYGQGWKWTTIIAHRKGTADAWQSLCPAEQEKIVATCDPVVIAEALAEWRRGKYNPDKSVLPTP